MGSTIYTLSGRSNRSQTIEAAPFLHEGRTMVPIRFIAEAMEVDAVNWDRSTRTVIIQRGSIILNLPVDVPLPNNMGTPVIVNGRTFVPVRYISEMLGAEVRWDRVTQAVYISWTS